MKCPACDLVQVMSVTSQPQDNFEQWKKLITVDNPKLSFLVHRCADCKIQVIWDVDGVLVVWNGEKGFKFKTEKPIKDTIFKLNNKGAKAPRKTPVKKKPTKKKVTKKTAKKPTKKSKAPNIHQPEYFAVPVVVHEQILIDQT